MAERAGYDQPGDGYTSKHSTIGVDVAPPYVGIPTPNQGYAQQQFPMQQPYIHNTNTNVVVNQPQTATVIIQPRPPDYMVLSILAYLCFWPTAICAIVNAYQANKLVNAGDYNGARKMSDNARAWIITSVFAGIIVITFFVVLQKTVLNKPNFGH